MLVLYKALTPAVKSVGMETAEAAVSSSTWEQMTVQQRQAAAAVAVFTKPPVRYKRDGKCFDVCLRIKRKETRWDM